MVRSTPIVPPATPLTDGSVVVRPRREDDLEAIADASRDSETLRWLDDPPMDAEARRTGMSRVEEAWRSGRAAPLTIADAVTDQAVGIINLQFRAEDVASVAYSVFPAHRGQGNAPRAVLLVADWALGNLGLTQLILETDAANTASTRVAEKCGFQAIGTRSEPRSDGVVRTTITFSRPLPTTPPAANAIADQHTHPPLSGRNDP
ncbi:GNAT family N-acetyltransferase [Micromonospora peucetia]|uniref:Protein N-acetyltransferase, RimJ/RimL family n=1 Tax=Micromonospora peucetia TaxID=47871 RepID=A0A1C6VTC8_9ACTN|nr:GNAT family protein [Micromonospora peucetia]SCL69462.1 Protein N-acetyltransferase, RimJ/RimL family [Micromonospora peucetia]